MAYVQPKSNIYLIKGCPCDRSYNNTIYFESKLTQWAYFRDLVTHTFTNQYYQRYNRGYLRIQANAEDLYEVNYMVFSNSYNLTPTAIPPNSAKIFYCFVDNIEYINENVTEIHYTIDIMQTYMFDYTLGGCYVEREHTLTDNLYENLVEENIGGDNFVNHLLKTELIPSHGYSKPLYSIMIAYSPNKEYLSLFNTLDPNGDPENADTGYKMFPDVAWDYESSNDPNFTLYMAGCAKNHTYSRLYYIFVDIPPFDDPDSIITIRSLMGHTVHALLAKSCTITNMILVPRQFSHNPDGNTFRLADWNSESFTYTLNIAQPTQLYTNNGVAYSIKNKKLLSYPFNYLKVNNLDGAEQVYMWEHFRKTENNHVFTIEGVCVSNPECKCIPGYYQGLSNPYTEYSLNISDFPTSAWSEDTMTSYLAQNKNKIAFGMVKNAINDFATLSTGSFAGRGSYAGSTTTRTSTPLTTTTKTLKHGTKTTVSGGDYTITNTPNYSEPTAGDYANDISNSSSNLQMIASIADISNKPDPVRGETNYSSLRNVHNLYGFKFMQVNLREDDARRIDNYFDMFGYAIKDVKIPNIKTAGRNTLRPHWNYIKNGFTIVLPYIEGNTKRYVSTDIEEAIQAIYDKGITFWMHGEEVGDYSLDNSPQA